MTNRTAAPGLVAIAMIALLAACGGTASSSPPIATNPPASQAAPSAPTPTANTAPSDGGAAEPSLDLSSLLPSFDLPSNAKDLEALLPNEICGGTVQKLSMAGADFAGMADEEFASTLAGLGKSASDVSFAVAAQLTGDGGCSAGVFRIAGADTGRLQEVFVKAAEDEGATSSTTSIGGKNVVILATTGETTKQYVYVKGDAVFFADAPDDAAAAEILGQMP